MIWPPLLPVAQCVKGELGFFSILGGNGRGYVITVQCEQRTGILQNSGRHFTNVSIINQNTVPCVKIAFVELLESKLLN